MIVRATAARYRQWALLVAGGAALWTLSKVFPQSWPSGIVTQGAFFGASAGLLAVGLVLTYRSTRMINFAYGAMGSTAAELGVVTYQHAHLPWAVCVLIALVGGALIGGGVHVVMRRFANAARLVVTVATIGLLQILVGLQFGIAFWSHANPLVTPFSTGLSTTNFTIGRTVFTANDLVALALAPLAVGALSWFLLRTDSGTAVRSMADNPERAQLLGIPIHRLSRLVWILVGVLAAAVMILNGPTNGLPTDPFVSVGGVFMPALAAAVIAKMHDLPTAFIGGVGLGIFDAVVSYNVHKEALTTVALLVVVLLALLVRRWPTTRGDADETSWSLSTNSRPLPPSVSRLPEVRVGRAAVLALLVAAAVLFPLLAAPSDIHTVAGYVVLGMAVLSLVVLSGWSGTISLGQMAIVGVGAVVTGDLLVKANLDIFLALAVGALAAAAASALIGLPALRVRPIFLAVTTLAFAAAMDQYFLNPSNYPSLIPVSILRPDLWKRFPLGSERAMYYVCIGMLAVTILIVRALKGSRPGRILQASRDNPRASAALAIATVRTRVGGMVVAGLIAGVAGGLWAVLQEGVGASSFPTQDSVTLFSMAVVGGLGSIYGSLSGVAVTEFLIFIIGRFTTQGTSFTSLGTGALLLGVLLVFPGGLGQAIESLRDRLVSALASRRGVELVVGAAAGSEALPSLTLSTPPSLTTSSNLVLSCRDLTASYGPLQVLFGVDLHIGENEIVALVGTNGAGKSTVFKAVSGLLASGGHITFKGMSLQGMQTDAIARCGVAMMPGGRGVFPSLTVAENLRLGCWQIRQDRAAAAQAFEEMSDMFPALRIRSQQQAGNLSGGEQQQLSLAMALAVKPKLLLIDELSLGLAPSVVSQLCEKVQEYHQAGTTIVIVEQSLDVALRLAQRAVFLEKGAVRFEGATAELANRPDLLRSVFIGSTPAPRDAEGADGSSSSSRRQYTDLVCQGISKNYGGIAALSSIDLTVEPGQIVGLIGHNGAGKTTLFDVISGFVAPSQGTVQLGGIDVTNVAPHHRALAGLGRSFQEARLFPSLTVTETIVAALDRHLPSHDWFAAALKAPPSAESERSARERCAELIELLGLAGYATTPIADLSTGTRRIVELACVVAMDPAVILLDEPSAGVAQKETEALGPLLKKIQQHTGCAILIIEHDMALLSLLCDELVALEQGEIICRGTPVDVLSHPKVIQSYLGSDELSAQRIGGRLASTDAAV
ncbi:MAG TPA: ATP-binding cassette domain-containing protein [Acidimicrobiales bacterium]|jgi:ABC-type branched-subunit amino acid transport system ATPase component/ABC-type branched-subunit amino acid transport system permease subunit|nr:ATP-binding cassette domain-containing protein [Acidimicrobiales bacterium]